METALLKNNFSSKEKETKVDNNNLGNRMMEFFQVNFHFKHLSLILHKEEDNH